MEADTGSGFELAGLLIALTRLLVVAPANPPLNLYVPAALSVIGDSTAMPAEITVSQHTDAQKRHNVLLVMIPTLVVLQQLNYSPNLLLCLRVSFE